MRRVLTIMIGLALLCLPLTSMAGIAGSVHDLTTWAGPGGTKDLCQACHIPHNANTSGSGGFLWAQTPSGTFSGVQDLCYTCHDGSVTPIGVTTAFNTSINIEQHKTVGSDCSGTDACHDVHNQNPNPPSGGRFIVVTETNNTYCETCHDVTPFPGAEALGDHTAGQNHFTSGTFTCNQCHSIHGAQKQTTNPGTLTNPILLFDNSITYYGSFCVTCHDGVAPAEATVGTGGVAASDQHYYNEPDADGTETMHPTSSAAMTSGCGHCHDVHDPTASPANAYILLEDNTNSAFCVSCHTTGDGPAIGTNTHFYNDIPSNTNMNSLTSPFLPWAHQIDDDGTAGADWALATTNQLVCETCHSVHRSTAVNGMPLMRQDNTANNEICTACHTNN